MNINSSLYYKILYVCGSYSKNNDVKLNIFFVPFIDQIILHPMSNGLFIAPFCVEDKGEEPGNFSVRWEDGASFVGGWVSDWLEGGIRLVEGLVQFSWRMGSVW